MRSRFLRSIAVTSILVASGGCGAGGDGDDGVSTEGTGGSDADLSAFQECMADQGVDLGDGGLASGGTPPDGTPPSFDLDSPPGSGVPGGGQFLPDGVDQEAFQAAIEECGDLAPEAFGGGPGGGGGLEALDAYLSCLVDNGVESAEATSDSTPPSVDETDPEYAAAQQTCAPLLPQPGGGSSTTTVTDGNG